MAKKKINYDSRSFADVRSELTDFVRQQYPSVLNDFNDASIGQMFIDLNAAVGDMLSFHTDRMFQESRLEWAQERSSLLSLARTFGLKIPGKRPAVTIADLSVEVPVRGDSYDARYAPIIRRGAQVTGAGKVFETMDDIDFDSPFTTGGLPNRMVIPNTDANNNIVSYTLTKREIVVNGSTKIHQRTINPNNVRPFMEVVLPDNDVLSIESVIFLDGTNFTTNPTLTQFFNDELRWYEMDALAEDTIFKEDRTGVSDNPGIVMGRLVNTDRKFITEVTDRGFTKLIFGGGTQDVNDSIQNFSGNQALIDRIGDFINNLSLGETPPPNTTMFVRYRVGGGEDSNIGPNVLGNTGNVDMIVNGPQDSINVDVQQSLSVNNPVPALGGREEPSLEEIRNYVRYNFASQNRAVTIPDYKTRIQLMPGEFGVPFRTGVLEERNKINVYVLGLDENGNLDNSSTRALRQNISEYLSDYRMMNDFVEVSNGQIVNIQVEVDLFVEEDVPRSQVVSEAVSEVRDILNKNNYQMGENIYLSPLFERINNISGVLNVIDIRIFNPVGNGKYSLNEISQPLVDEETRQVDLLGEFTLFGDPITMFELKFPGEDVSVRIKRG